jgi:hypothetical protein
MQLPIRTDRASQQLSISQQSSANFLKPQWLKEGEYDSSRWVVVDDNAASPKPSRAIRFDIVVFDPLRPNEQCRLTDPEYSHLLDTVKRQSYGLRTGKYARVTTAKTHEEMARAIINWVLWMIQNRIRHFSHLDQADLNAYIEGAIYGPGHLLKYASHLTECVKKLKEANTPIPYIKRELNALPFLDIKTLLESINIDPHRAGADKAISYELKKIAKAEGFYLNPTQIKRLLQEAPAQERLVHVAFLRMLQPWDYQWRMRDDLPSDHIQFEPFGDITPDQLSHEMGKAKGRTKTAPVKQTMQLIDRSLRWVLDYAPILLDLRDKYDSLAADYTERGQSYFRMAKIIRDTIIPDGPGRPFPLSPSTKSSITGSLAFGKAINEFIPAACAVVIASFSGRRHDEILSIRTLGSSNEDCISRDNEGLWIETYLEKTVQDWVKTPCNEVVAAAVEILRRWSAPARTLSSNPRLFQFKVLTSNHVTRFRLLHPLKEFVSFLNLCPMPDGSHWEYKPHQFRRFFAIMYFWQYQYRDLTALSYHLRHLNPAMTQMYVTESESGEIFRHVNKEYTSTILTEAAIGERNISGPFGERFKTVARKLRARYRQTIKVVSPRLVQKVVERHVEKNGRRLKAMPWGYCACGTLPHQVRVCRCLSNSLEKAEAGPDFSQSSPTICAGCPHHVTEPIFEPFLRNEIEFHERAATDAQNGAILRETSYEHVEKLRSHHTRSFKNSEPLERLHE